MKELLVGGKSGGRTVTEAGSRERTVTQPHAQKRGGGGLGRDLLDSGC